MSLELHCHHLSGCLCSSDLLAKELDELLLLREERRITAGECRVELPVALKRKKFYIVTYGHRHGQGSWPVFQRQSPTLKSLLRKEKWFADCWEGKHSKIHSGDEPRDDEWISIDGPFFTPTP